eukprot:SAG22_NODE_1439_length_4416_cov_25.417940_1_plen_56_part_10
MFLSQRMTTTEKTKPGGEGLTSSSAPCLLCPRARSTVEISAFGKLPAPARSNSANA